MKHTTLLRRMTAATVAAVMAGTCMNIPVFAQAMNDATSNPADTVFEMKDFSSVSETTQATANDKAADFTSYGGVWSAGESVRFNNIDFSSGEYTTLMLLLSARDDQKDKKIEVHLDKPDGELLSTITVETTSDDEEYFQEHYGALASVNGVHDIYFVFPEECNLNFDWFTFSSYNGTETEEEKAERMKWWNEARFGQFIHWGAYALPGGIYEGRDSVQSEWLMSLLNVSKEKYTEIATEPFNPTKFDAKKIVSDAKAAGQKYIVYTSRHHDGVSMFDTKVKTFKDYALFSTCNYGNYEGVDPMLELSKECKKQGIKFCTYITIMDWHDPSQTNYGATMDPEQKDEFVYRLKAQIRELIEVYDTELIWFDGQWQSWWTEEDARDLYEYARTLKPSIIINNRVGHELGDYGTPEQEIPETGLDYDWESCMTLNYSWGYHKTDNRWKSPQTVIDNLVDCASKGGNYLLNVGPDEEGVVPQGSLDVLKEVGKWLDVYGDSIYGTQHNCFEKLPKGVKATVKDGKIYLHVTDMETNTTLSIPGIKNEIVGVKVMGTDQQLDYDVMKDKIAIDLSDVEANEYDTVIEIDVKGFPEAVEQPADVNYALQASSVETDNVYMGMEEYDQYKAVDGKEDTRWATSDGTTSATLVLNFDQAVTVNSAYISQFTGPINYINKFSVDYWDGSQWLTAYQGGSVGDNITVDFDPVTTTKIRLNLIDACNPSIQEFGLYCREQFDVTITEPVTPTSPEPPIGTAILENGMYTISGTSKGGTEVDVTISGNGFQAITETALVNEDGTWTAQLDSTGIVPGKVTIKAVLRDEEGIVAVTSAPAIVRGYKDLAKNKPVEVSSYYSAEAGYDGVAAVDGIIGTRWAPNDGDNRPVMTVDLQESTTFNRIMLTEYYDTWYTPNEYRCREFQIEAFDGNEWTVIHNGTTIEEDLIIDFDQPVTAQKLRLTILKSRTTSQNQMPPASIVEFEVYNTASEPEPTATPVPTQKPEPTATPVPTQKPEATATPVPTQKPEATATPAPSAAPSPTAVPQPDPTAAPAQTAAPGSSLPATGDTLPLGALALAGVMTAAGAVWIARRRVS